MYVCMYVCIYVYMYVCTEVSLVLCQGRAMQVWYGILWFIRLLKILGSLG